MTKDLKFLKNTGKNVYSNKHRLKFSVFDPSTLDLENECTNKEVLIYSLLRKAVLLIIMCLLPSSNFEMNLFFLFLCQNMCDLL